MLSKNKIKFIRSLQTKKARETEQCYVAEGERIVKDLLQSNCFIIEIIALPEWIATNITILKNIPTETATKVELQTISSLTTPQNVIALIQIPKSIVQISDLSNQLIIGLDTIQDPGNMGTIIRLANWFGIEHILCSNDCVDVYNPKVVQASMGAIGKTTISYCNLAQTIQDYVDEYKTPIYGTFLEGENIYSAKLSTSGIILLGNEGNGISADIEKLVNTKLNIPSFNEKSVVESLNVSIAAAIVCSEFRRR